MISHLLLVQTDDIPLLNIFKKYLDNNINLNFKTINNKLYVMDRFHITSGDDNEDHISQFDIDDVIDHAYNVLTNQSQNKLSHHHVKLFDRINIDLNNNTLRIRVSYYLHRPYHKTVTQIIENLENVQYKGETS